MPDFSLYAGCSFRGRSYVEGEFFKICDSCLYQCLGGRAKEVACRRGKKRQMVMAARKGNPGDAKKRKKKAKMERFCLNTELEERTDEKTKAKGDGDCDDEDDLEARTTGANDFIIHG